MKFKINKKYYIRVLDEKNWIIAHLHIPKPKNLSAQAKEAITGHEREPYEKIFGFFRTLQEAKEEAAELVAKEAKDMKELEKAIELIKSIEA